VAVAHGLGGLNGLSVRSLCGFQQTISTFAAGDGGISPDLALLVGIIVDNIVDNLVDTG